MDFKDKLLLIRKENNMTQEDLANELGVTRQAVQKWEVGASFPKMDKIQRISELFNYSVADLIGLDDILLNRVDIYLPKKGATLLMIINILVIFPNLLIIMKNHYSVAWFLLCSVLPAFISYITFHYIKNHLYFSDFPIIKENFSNDFDINKLKNLYYQLLFYIILFLLIINLLNFINYLIEFPYYSLILFIIEIFGLCSIIAFYKYKIKKKIFIKE